MESATLRRSATNSLSPCRGAAQIAGANRDGALAASCAAPRQGDRAFVAPLRSVADSSLRHHDDPVPAVDAILSALDAASRVARHEANCGGFLRAADLGLQLVHHRRGVVDHEAFTFTLGG